MESAPLGPRQPEDAGRLAAPPERKPEAVRPEPEQSQTAEGMASEFARISRAEDMSLDARMKAVRRLSSSVTDRLAALDRQSGEHADLVKTRRSLGMSEPKPLPDEMSRERQALAELQSDLERGLMGAKREHEAEAHETAIREGAAELAQAVEMFGAEIVRRQKAGMDPFFDQRSFGSVKGGMHGMREFAGSKATYAAAELATAVMTVSAGLEKIGQTRQGGPVKESRESLSRLSAALMEIDAACAKLERSAREGDENLTASARKLRNLSTQVAGNVARMRRQVEQYLGR